MNPWKLSTVALTLALGIVAGGSFVTPAAADQPAMQTALDHLKQAKAALESAAHDHGGHRTKALKDTEHAIKEVTEGIAWAEQHPGDGTGKSGGGTGKAGGGTGKGGGGTPKQ